MFQDYVSITKKNESTKKNCTIGWRDRIISNGCHIFNYQYFIINIFIFCDYCWNEFDKNLLTAGDFDPHKNLTKVHVGN